MGRAPISLLAEAVLLWPRTTRRATAGGSGEEGDATEVRYPSNGWLIAGNHLKGVEPILADIWLTEATAENTVICRCRADLVIDDGVDNEIVYCTLAPPEEPDISLRSMTTTRLVRPDKALPLQGTRRGR